MGLMASELIFYCFGGQKRSLLPLYSGERALHCEGETASVRLAKSVNMICEGITSKYYRIQYRATLH